jgi:hypothetical protein
MTRLNRCDICKEESDREHIWFHKTAKWVCSFCRMRGKDINGEFTG